MSKNLEDLKLYGFRNRRKYLNENDWYCTRLVRTEAVGAPVAIPAAILTKMQLAADEIDLIRDATTFAEVSSVPIDFE